MQVSPTEIEDTILAHPDKLLVDVAVAGVLGGRIADERVPRAWVVLSEAGKRKGEAAVIKTIEAWTKETLSSYKRLRGGIEIVSEVNCFAHPCSRGMLTHVALTSPDS